LLSLLNSPDIVLSLDEIHCPPKNLFTIISLPRRADDGAVSELHRTIRAVKWKSAACPPGSTNRL